MSIGTVAVDIGGSHITSVMIKDLNRGHFCAPLHKSPVLHSENKNVLLNTWRENIGKTIESHYSNFNGEVAIAIPGPFDYKLGIGESGLNDKFQALNGVSVRSFLFENFPMINKMHFINDASAYGLGEHFYGPLKNYQRSLAITLGTGIGSAFMEYGKILSDDIRIPLNGEIYHLPFLNGIADEYFSTRWFIKAAMTIGNIEVDGLKELIEKADSFMLEKIFNIFGQQLFEFLTRTTKTFSPQAIVFGGNISKAWSHFSKELIHKFSNEGVDIYCTELNENAICLGAVHSLLQDIS